MGISPLPADQSDSVQDPQLSPTRAALHKLWTSRRNDHPFRVATALLFSWAVGIALTVLILVSPLLLPGFRSLELSLILDTADACIALLAVYLLIGRFHRDRGLRNLILAQGLAMLPIGGFFLLYGAQLWFPESPAMTYWLPTAVRQIGAVLILIAALLPDAVADRYVSRRMSSGLWLGLAGVTVALVVLLALGSSTLPDPVADELLVGSLASGHPLRTVMLAIGALSFLTASVAFAVRALHVRDHLIFWLGAACAFAGFARINYLLFPSPSLDWLYTGDLLRTGFYALLLIGAGKEIRRHWDSLAVEAVTADRRRIARELHDGVIQELAFIRSESHSLPAGSRTRDQLIGAADRAIDEARAALAALEHSGKETLSLSVYSAAREAAQRFGVGLEVDLDESTTAEPGQQHALARITREAISNAARHGRAGHVVVTLRTEDGRRHLSISDDGTGFDVGVAEQRRGGYGLISMRERSHALPGTFDISSETGMGSVVTVTW